MKGTFPHFLLAILCSTLLSAPATSFAIKGDCGQPSSLGPAPSIPDVLTILREAVGQATDCDAKPCVCDVDGDGDVDTRDALLMLRRAVGHPVPLLCHCEPVEPACTSAVLEIGPGSELDYGWTGIAHDSPLNAGTSIGLDILRRCSDSGEPCLRDGDCANLDCRATCDCSGDTTCELTGPTQARRCLTTLKECAVNADCGTTSCVSVFAPPQPLSSGGTPICMLNVMDGPISGTADLASGELEMSFNLKSRIFLGITMDKPCPRCGEPADSPQIGDTFNCSGGQFENAPCEVHGVSAMFGGTSFDCPPKLDANVSGAGLALRFPQLATGTASNTAGLPCSDSAFGTNPGLPLNQCIGGSAPGAACSANAECAGGGVCNIPTCLGTIDSCSSNADCKRCTGDPGIDCSNNAGACSGNGTCAEAPEQPVTCGFWCHCGFCNGNASRPCFQTGDCPAGETCQMGPGAGSAQNTPQRKPNDCAQDSFVCGQLETEHCATTPAGVCSEQPYRSCTAGSATCENGDGGTCVIGPRPCFESRITRSGTPSPLGSYCAFESRTCSSNADCSSEPSDFCTHDASRPESVALFCMGALSSAGKNNVAGITGPAAVRLKSLLRVCRCGDGILGCDEQCDDGNLDAGDGCDDLCRQE